MTKYCNFISISVLSLPSQKNQTDETAWVRNGRDNVICVQYDEETYSTRFFHRDYLLQEICSSWSEINGGLHYIYINLSKEKISAVRIVISDNQNEVRLLTNASSLIVITYMHGACTLSIFEKEKLLEKIIDALANKTILAPSRYLYYLPRRSDNKNPRVLQH